MSRKRYRVGIDVGLYSVGLSAIEIDENTENPLDANPIAILNIQSVIHDGAIDPSAEKSADSRKKISGEARRARNLKKPEGREKSYLQNCLPITAFQFRKLKPFLPHLPLQILIYLGTQGMSFYTSASLQNLSKSFC